MTDYNKLHEDKLEELKKKVLGSAINDKLNLKVISNNKLEEVIQKMNIILAPRTTWNNTYFRTGRIIGILKSLADNSKVRDELLKITGLTQTHIDLYFEVCGNTPYVKEGSTVVELGRPMKVNECKELITLVGAHFGYIVEESDLYDITQERWDSIYNSELERAKETAESNKKNKGKIPQEYEE